MPRKAKDATTTAVVVAEKPVKPKKPRKPRGPVESAEAKAARARYLELGLDRTLEKLAELYADDWLYFEWASMANNRDAYNPVKRDKMLKQLKQDGEARRQWEGRTKIWGRKFAIWRRQFQWDQAAQDFDYHTWTQAQRTTIREAHETNVRHQQDSKALLADSLYAINLAYEKYFKGGELKLPQSLVQMALGAFQIERAAHGLAGGKSTFLLSSDPQTLMAQLERLNAPTSRPTLENSGEDSDTLQQVNITNVTNITQVNNNTANLLSGPLTLDALKHLDAQVRAELNAERQAQRLPLLGSGEDPWSDSAVPPPPPGVSLTPEAPVPQPRTQAALPAAGETTASDSPPNPANIIEGEIIESEA